MGLGQKAEKEFDKATLKLRIAELSGSLLKAQLALGEAQLELTEKDAAIAKLQANFKQKADLIEAHGFYYRVAKSGKPQGRPYCPHCLDKGHLMMTVLNEKPGRLLACPTCKNTYKAPDYFFEGE